MLVTAVQTCCNSYLNFFQQDIHKIQKQEYLGECTVGLFQFLIYDRQSIHLMSVGMDKLDLTGRTIDI
jgi:hypothetical protein